MTICPGRRDRGRDLGQDLRTLRDAGVGHLVCLLSDEELESVGVIGLRGAAEGHGIELWQLPIRDQGVASLEETDALVQRVLAALDAGDRVVLHCMGGLGRTGTIAACALVARGLGPEEAIAAVRRSRDPRAVENLTQDHFITTFARR
jgi:protein-tyrosine phosphatase